MPYSSNLIPLMIGNASPYGRCYSSSDRSTSYYPFQAFDRLGSSRWSSSSAGKLNCWVQYTFLTSKIITKYLIGSTGTEAPKAWTFEGYDTATSSWVTLDTQSGKTDWVAGNFEYEFANTTAYTDYRVYITEQNGGTYTSVYNLEMYAEADLKPLLAGITLQAEYDTGNPIAQIGGIMLQVEVDAPTYSGPTTHIPIIEVLELQVGSHTLEASSDTNTMNITAHGLDVADMVFNYNRGLLPSNSITETGSASVITVTSLDSVELNRDIAGQTVGDIVYFYKWIDRTDKIKQGTLSVSKQAQGLSEASFEIICSQDGGAIDYRISKGQLVRVSLDGVTQCVGVASEMTLYSTDVAPTAIFQNVRIAPLKNIATRRTVPISYNAGDTCGDIVADVFIPLAQEGIILGTVDPGITLGQDWVDDCMSVAQILDECADRSGYQWFIDNDMKLQFYREPASVVDAPFDIDDTALTCDVENVILSESIENYNNKIFVCGNNDDEGNQIVYTRNSLLDIAEMRSVTGGSGVWGTVVKNDSVSERVDFTLEATSDTNTMMITGHGLEIGDMVYNLTRDTTTWVTGVEGVNEITVEVVASQTAGDVVHTYPSASAIATNTLIQNSTDPIIIEFDTYQIGFDPMQKLGVKLTRYGMAAMKYFCIESVTMQESGIVGSTPADGHLWRCHVKAIQKIEADFGTQRRKTYYDYYRRIFSRLAGFGYARGSTNSKRTVSAVAPRKPKLNDEWLDISSSPAVAKYWDGNSWET